MLHSRRDKLAILYHCSEHFRDRMLREDTVFLALLRQTDIDAAAFGGCDLDPEAVLRQVDLTRICRVELDGRCASSDL